jgi:hypothetical protein
LIHPGHFGFRIRARHNRVAMATNAAIIQAARIAHAVSA